MAIRGGIASSSVGRSRTPVRERPGPNASRWLGQRGDVHNGCCYTAAVTALHIASQKGDTAAVELLLQHNAPLDAQDKNGATPLCRAAFDNQLECSSLLVLAGADVAITARGMTAQQLAEQKGHKKVAALLRDPAAAFRDHNAGQSHAARLL